MTLPMVFADAGRLIGVVLLGLQVWLLFVLLARLAPGYSRRPPIAPRRTPRSDTTVTVMVTTLNEAKRVGPCLEGLMQQDAPLLEVLVVDSRSTDGTRELVEAAARKDPRIRLVTDDPLPPGWVGKVWALENGLREAKGDWVLGIDADTVPAPGLVGAVIDAVEQDGYDVASFSPQFRDQTPAERFVQPAMLTTLVYRCGAAGATQPPPDRVLANGQCFVARRDLLLAHGGYSCARTSWCDDVTLARHLAANGARVGFLDGSQIIQVRSYASLGEMWREWGRSFDLKDATPMWRRWLDVALVWAVQGLPLPILLVLGALIATGTIALTNAPNAMLWKALLLVNGSALFIRLFMLWALRGSYAERGVTFWLSWLADLGAAWRLTLSTARRPKAWRGRSFESLPA
ncbi:glycosyltransferase [Gemmatimonas sp.]|uniref:glycosyltransferase n=1 Tax=Gemmatimonas sp. TaxID=1962908 RepID=UPI0022C25BF0|nr:glycosyltransferase [Gemmatimonas sp.]MCZ8204622.1 glycosyltransferase [Gemmatimonas sp.]